MDDQELFSLQYPIGKFSAPADMDDELILSCIDEIAAFPARLRNEVAGLSTSQLDTPYRPEGWTIRQVVHHCADSHINSWMRFKLALTEDKPIIRPYFEDRWAELPDSKLMEIEPALLLLDALHTKWVYLLRSLTSAELSRVFIHPEHGKEYKLALVICLYSWHCSHHLAHISSLRSRQRW